jgi:hypothetical protein
VEKGLAPPPEGFYDAHAPRVYGAALAATGEERLARSAALDALRHGGRLDTMVEHALLTAARMSGQGPFAHFASEDRDAIVLARLGGYSVSRIATALAIERHEVKLRLTRGLRSAAGPTAPRRGLSAVAPRTPRPRRDFESAASRAPDARAS